MLQVGDRLKAQVTAQQIKGQHVNFETKCFNMDGEILIDGNALARLPKGHSMMPDFAA